MKTANYLSLTAVILAGLSSAASANVVPPDGLRLGIPTSGGTGCPAGTASATASPDGKSVSILFDNYVVTAGGNTGKQIERKTCDIVIPVTVPQGYSVSVLAIDYRGFNNLPPGSTSRFDVEYFFAGSQGPGFSRTFYGELSDNFTFHNDVLAASTVWSACGASVNLRTNSAMMVQTNNYRQEAMASVDSADVSASVVYQLQWRRCDGSAPIPNPGPGNGGYPPSDPFQYQGNCTIDQYTDNYGRTTWFVRDIRQNQIARVASYQEALQIAQQSDANGRCLGPSNPNPYPPAPRPQPPRPQPPRPQPPRPQPYPQPQPMPLPIPGPGGYRASCQINTPAGVFIGQGYDQGNALANARNQCIRQTNNSRVCMTGPVSCR